MSSSSTATAAHSRPPALGVLGSLSATHMINDMMQSLILALYPILKGGFHLNFAQIGIITLTYQLTASLFQPLIGLYTDKRHLPNALPLGMGFTLLGLLLLAFAPNYATLLAAAAFVGLGSAVFHPESARIARFASGGRHGFAQSMFQVGGNTGSAIGPLLAALIIAPYGQSSIAWFSVATLIGIWLLFRVSRWYAINAPLAQGSGHAHREASLYPRRVAICAIAVLLVLIFSKYFYIAGISTFYTFYLIDKFGVSVQDAQMHLFIFLFASAAGTLIGGPIGDRIGRKPVIWMSILGIAPFALALPYVNLFWTVALMIVIGCVLSSAFSAILVYAQELVPGKVGMISGLFFGFAFGMGGLGAAVLGVLADRTSIAHVYQVIAFLPLLGCVAILLPKSPQT